MRIAVAACGCEGPETLAERTAKGAQEIGAELAVGGCWGLMGRVVKNTILKGVEVTVFLPEGGKCHYPVKVIETGMSPNARSVLLTHSSDALLALGGGAGTVMEVFMAYRERKPIALITGYDMDSDKFFDVISENGIDSRSLSPIKVFKDPIEAMMWLRDMI